MTLKCNPALILVKYCSFILSLVCIKVVFRRPRHLSSRRTRLAKGSGTRRGYLTYGFSMLREPYRLGAERTWQNFTSSQQQWQNIWQCGNWKSCMWYQGHGDPQCMWNFISKSQHHVLATTTPAIYCISLLSNSSHSNMLHSPKVVPPANVETLPGSQNVEPTQCVSTQ